MRSAPASARARASSANRLCQELVDRELAWLYSDLGLGRRGEKLVLWSVLDAGNYDYVMYYAFWDDGTIEVRAGATGQKLDGPTTPPATPTPSPGASTSTWPARAATRSTSRTSASRARP